MSITEDFVPATLLAVCKSGISELILAEASSMPEADALATTTNEAVPEMASESNRQVTVLTSVTHPFGADMIVLPGPARKVTSTLLAANGPSFVAVSV